MSASKLAPEMTRKVFGQKFGRSFFVLACLTGGCESLTGVNEKLLGGPVGIPTDESGGGRTPAQQSDGDPIRACYTETFRQPATEAVKKLDILFISDTSGSIKPERRTIAYAIKDFVKQLPADVDYRLGVTLAHGLRWSGKLYQAGSLDPLVLDSKKHKLGKIQESLSSKLYQGPSEWASAGGEIGMRSLYNSFEPANFAAMQSAGFYRADAALTVIFISDENDLCAIYPEGVLPRYDPQRYEDSSRGRFCYPLVGNQEIRFHHNMVYERLKAFKGNYPLIVGGLLYNNLATVPNQNSPTAQDEYGYGYMDLIKEANGVSVDLASPKFDVTMSILGKLSMVKMALRTEFDLAGSGFDSATLEVRRDANISVPFEYDAKRNRVKFGNPGQAGSNFTLSYCGYPVPSSSSSSAGTGSSSSHAVGSSSSTSSSETCVGPLCDVVGI